MPEIAINQTTCTRCGACVALCTGPVYKRLDDRIEAATPDNCWLCGHCVAVCPADAIAHSAYPIEECPILDAAALPSLDGLVCALRERRSARVFRRRPCHARWFESWWTFPAGYPAQPTGSLWTGLLSMTRPASPR